MILRENPTLFNPRFWNRRWNRPCGPERLLPLEQFEVNEFQLVSIVIGPGGNKAMVQDASGKGYLLPVGSKIGKNQGRVVAIVPRQC